jgi:polyisoprenoid-binding protein YceI
VRADRQRGDSRVICVGKRTGMKFGLFFIFLYGLTAAPCRAQFQPLDGGSSVQFKIKNFGFTVTGSFSGLKGYIRFDSANLSVDSFNVSVDAASINTDNDLRDGHLREESYFDVKNHPRILLVSNKITGSNKSGVLFLFGKLTIKKVTRDISFPFTATASEGGLLFKGQFKINRKDFDIGGSSTISDNWK